MAAGNCSGHRRCLLYVLDHPQYGSFMRCWKTPKNTFLVESPNIRRMIQFDPMIKSEGRVLLREAKSWLSQNLRGERISGFLRYHEVDLQGVVARSYEEYSCSDEDDLYSCSYLVLGAQLWEFWLTHTYEQKPTLKVKALISDLEVAELPAGTTVTG